jgi:hypothetical protein
VRRRCLVDGDAHLWPGKRGCGTWWSKNVKAAPVEVMPMAAVLQDRPTDVGCQTRSCVLRRRSGSGHGDSFTDGERLHMSDSDERHGDGGYGDFIWDGA